MKGKRPPTQPKTKDRRMSLAGVAELADARDLKFRDRKVVWVRSPPPAPSDDNGPVLSSRPSADLGRASATPYDSLDVLIKRHVDDRAVERDHFAERDVPHHGSRLYKSGLLEMTRGAADFRPRNQVLRGAPGTVDVEPKALGQLKAPCRRRAIGECAERRQPLWPNDAHRMTISRSSGPVFDVCFSSSAIASVPG
jgi:hypothetical protein